MSQKVYKLWRIKRWTEAWLQLPKEEQDKIFDQVMKSLESVGGKSTIRCTSYWANEACLAWGVSAYPDLEAAQHGLQPTALRADLLRVARPLHRNSRPVGIGPP